MSDHPAQDNYTRPSPTNKVLMVRVEHQFPGRLLVFHSLISQLRDLWSSAKIPLQDFLVSANIPTGLDCAGLFYGGPLALITWQWARVEATPLAYAKVPPLAPTAVSDIRRCAILRLAIGIQPRRWPMARVGH